jgi:hypothetical protein
MYNGVLPGKITKTDESSVKLYFYTSINERIVLVRHKDIRLSVQLDNVSKQRNVRRNIYLLVCYYVAER